MDGNEELVISSGSQLLLFLAVVFIAIFIVSAMLSALILYIRKRYINALINKNMYNWITYTNFGKATTLLNAISKEYDIKSFENKGPWTNFRKVNNMFCKFDKEELELMRDYLNKTNRKFGLFEDRVVNMLLVATTSISIVVSFVFYLINSDGKLLIFISFVILFLFVLLQSYEKERNTKEVMLMLIQRGLDGNNYIDIKKHNQNYY